MYNLNHNSIFPGGALYNSMFGYTNGCENGLRPPHAAAAAAAAFGLPPHMSLFYWPYPSPPISPNNYFSLQQQPQMVCTIFIFTFSSPGPDFP